MKTTLIILLLAWIGFTSLHGLLIVLFLGWSFMGIATVLKRSEIRQQGINWNNPQTNWNK